MRSSTRFKRVAGCTAVAMSFVLAVAGCSSSSSSSDGKTKLSLMMWDPEQQAGVQKAVDGFEKANPDIAVDVQMVPQAQYFTKLDASLQAGEGPDVMWQSSSASQYVKGGALEPLDSYIKQSGLKLSDYPAKLTNLYKFDGKQYGVPKDEDVWSFIYNTAVFKKLGITDVPKNDWTWDDMVRIATEIKAKQTSSADYPMYYNTTFNNGAAGIVHQLGSTVVKDNRGNMASPQGTEALERIKKLQDDKLIPPVKDSADFSVTSALVSGTIAMGAVPSYFLSDLTKASLPSGTLHAVPVPSVNGSRATDTNGLVYTMNAQSSHKDAAWKLIQYLTSDEGATLHVEGGAGFAANTSSSVEDAYYKANSMITGLKEAYQPMLADSYLRTTTQYPATRPNFPEIESAMGDYLAGSISAPDVEKKIDSILTDALK
ncbi:ABC transporter substrate-binding protein [Streptomyces sp. NPDC091280]|uniref:ABC transporter substrate-binding protein n=1 Tax=Streptomyces sp. NPDC091280 TaxID=3365984 RepID=UPI00381C47EA